MNISINSIDELLNNAHKMPLGVLQDIDKRIGDWLSMGGTIEDGYIKQQFRYAENIINAKRDRRDE